MDIKQIRVRIMSEAYDLADRGDHEGYNAIKVMCSDVLELIGKQWVGLTADEIWKCNKASGSAVEFHICYEHQNVLDFAESIEEKLKEKNA